jgi:MFS family permease
LILAFAPNLACVFLGRILDGLTAGNISLAQASISDFTPPEGRARAFSKIGIAFGVGFLIGPALSGYLTRYGYVVPILAGAGLSASSIVATTFLLPTAPRPAEHAPQAPTPGAVPAARARVMLIDTQSFARYFAMPALRLRLSQFFTFILSFSLYTSCFALFAMRRLTLDGKPFGASEVAYVLAYGGGLGIILQGFLMGRLVDRFGEKRLVRFGLSSMAIGYMVMSQAYGLGLAIVAATFSSLGHGIVRPSLTSLITRSADRREQGAVLGVNQSLQATAQILAPLIGGALIQRDLTSTWACTAAAAALGALALERVLREPALAPGGPTPRS